MAKAGREQRPLTSGQTVRKLSRLMRNAEKFQELRFKNPTLKFQTSDVWNLKFSVMDKLPKPLVTACKVVSAGNRIVLQHRNQGGSFIEDVRSKQETNL